MFDGMVKIVLAGPVGAGKTTTLRSLSDGEPVSTEMRLTDGPMGEKTTTTVALDFSTVILDDGTPLQMFGLPGQAHFEHMRPIILQGALGVIVLLAADQADILERCSEWLDAIQAMTPDTPVAIGITRSDQVRDFRMDTLRALLTERGATLPVFTIDARDREQAQQLVRALVYSIPQSAEAQA
jgi:small GTP-binding protein